MKRRSFLHASAKSAALALVAGAAPAMAQRTTVQPASAAEAAPVLAKLPEISADAAVLLDFHTGKVLFAKNATKRRQVASTQKLMTALLICESGNLDRICTVEVPETKVPPSKMFLKVGTTYTRKELLKALLVKSANDCASCLGRNHAGSEEAFAALMTRRAIQLGMRDSKFANASGLEGPQYSTAYDMALLGRVAMFQPVIREIVAMKKAVFNHADGKPRLLENTNDLLSISPYCTGMKTGYIQVAGKCLVSSATHKGRSVIAVVLGSTSRTIWKESKALLHFGLGV